ncbi:unnamed protein product [Diamesa hyperborea]
MKFVLVVMVMSLAGGCFGQGFFENKERTLIIMKPDGVQRGLIGEVMKRFEDKQYKLVGLKIIMPTRKLLEQHYAVHKEKFFFNTLIEYMMGGPLIPMVWEGYNVVDTGRKIIGLTQPSLSAVGTIRGDYAINVNYTIVHGAHSIEEAKAEINLWFKKDDFVTYNVLEC